MYKTTTRQAETEREKERAGVGGEGAAVAAPAICAGINQSPSDRYWSIWWGAMGPHHWSVAKLKWLRPSGAFAGKPRARKAK